MSQDNLLIVLSGPSGAGKGTICQSILSRRDTIRCAVSATSREIRKNEIDGVTYHYMSKETFEKKIENKEFLEYANVYGNFYGTLKEEVLNSFEQGLDTILEIDIQGALQIKENFPGAICVFIMPPSFSELKSRILNRGRESAEEIEKRMCEVQKELDYISEYDYVLINDEVEKATSKLECILSAEKLRILRRTLNVRDFIEK